MNGFCERFTPLIVDVFHCAYSDEALSASLNELDARLTKILDKEKSAPLSASLLSQTGLATENFPDLRRCLNQARFAVAVWADEQMLHSPRPDASFWAARSFQLRYFGTYDGGALFYQELEKCLDACGVPRRLEILKDDNINENENENINGNLPLSEIRLESEGFPLDFAPRESGEPVREWHVLSLPERLEAAVSLCPNDAAPLLAREAVKVFALCLLWGFRGSLYNEPETLEKLRECSRKFFPRPAEIQPPAPYHKKKDRLLLVERILRVAVPAIVCFLFALYCAGILANAPIPE